jgi:serine phosphatase RsbU (regulator of sigma subunit)
VAGPRSTALVDDNVDRPLGVSTEQHRHNSTIELQPGGVVALFTDGLVERRGEVLDQGLERLCAAITLESAERSCRAAIAALVPDHGWADDAALLVIRRGDDIGDRPGRLDVAPS